MNEKRFYVLLDLDGVVVRWPHQDVVDYQRKAELLEYLARCERSGINFHFIPITNRPGGNMQYICYDWKVRNGVCITESGATAYLPHHNVEIINPRFEEYRKIVRPQILECLKNKLPEFGFGTRFQEQPGNRLVTLEIVARDREKDLAWLQKTVPEILKEHEYFNLIRFEAGKSIVAHPKESDKAEGLIWFETLFGKYQDMVFPWTQSLWIADTKRDAVAARYVAQRGGKVAAVGGSKPEYIQAVQELGGIVVEGTYEAGLKQILQAFLS